MFFNSFLTFNLPFLGRWARSFSHCWWSCWALIKTWHPKWWHHAAFSICHWWASDHGIWGRGHWAPACTCDTIVVIYRRKYKKFLLKPLRSWQYGPLTCWWHAHGWWGAGPCFSRCLHGPWWGSTCHFIVTTERNKFCICWRDMMSLT